MTGPGAVQWRLLLVAAVLLIGSALVLSTFTVGSFERAYVPLMEEKARTVGDSLSAQVQRAVDYGVPLAELRGLDELFATVQREHPDIAWLALADAEGELLAQRYREDERLGRAAEDDLRVQETPIAGAGARVLVGSDRRYIREQLRETVIDIVTVLLVSGLVAVELLMFLTSYMVSSPLRELRRVMSNGARGDWRSLLTLPGGDELARFGAAVNRGIVRLNARWQAAKTPEGWRIAAPGRLRGAFGERLGFIRPPLFLLIFSESMSLSFFPVYVDTLYEPMAGLAKGVVIGLPISVFMFIWAVSLPFAGQWSDRVGRRRSFLIGAALTAVGLVLTGLAEDLWQLLIVRSLTAVGYGIVFISAQGYVTDHTTPENRTKGMALFLSGFFSGSLCGAAIGGILADRIGFELTFYLSAGLSLASALFVSRFLVEAPREADKPAPPRLSLADFTALLGNRYFVVVTFLAAIPAKVALTGFLYYAGPLYLVSLGASQSAAGRVLMTYGLAIVLISPLAAWVADKVGRRHGFVSLGGLLSGLALLLAWGFDNMAGMLGGVLLLGIAHAIGVSPQLSLITDMQNRPGVPEVPIGKTIGIFRLTERIGNISGPLIAGVLISVYGFEGTFFGMGVFTLSCVALFTLLMWWFRREDARLALREARVS